MLSFQGGVRVASYTASKSGLAGLTKLLANEWAAQGINVNAIAPGYFATNNTAALQADEKRNRQILERIPAGRWGLPERSRRRGGVPRLGRRRTMCTASSWRSTAAGWRAEPERKHRSKRVVCFGELLLRSEQPGTGAAVPVARLDAHFGGAEATSRCRSHASATPRAWSASCPTSPSATRRWRAQETRRRRRRRVARRRAGMGLYFLSPGAGPRPSAVLYDRAGSAFALAPPTQSIGPRALAGARWLHLSGVTPRARKALRRQLRVRATAAAASSRSTCPSTATSARSSGALGGGNGVPVLLPRDPGVRRPGVRRPARRGPAAGRGPSSRPTRWTAVARPRPKPPSARFPQLARICSTIRTANDARRHELAAVMFTRTHELKSRTYALDGIVDRIGAGDAFTAGVLHGARRRPRRAEHTRVRGGGSGTQALRARRLQRRRSGRRRAAPSPPHR